MTKYSFDEHERIIYLLSKRLQQPLSEEETEEIQTWCRASPANQLLFDKLNNPSDVRSAVEKMQSYDLEVSMGRLNRQLRARDRKKYRLVYWLAASILILFGIGVLLMHGINKMKMESDILPGASITQLKLYDGSIVNLDSLPTGKSTMFGGVQITKTANGQINCNYSKAEAKEPTGRYSTIVTPVGGEYRIVLPDGSLVWLNANSSLAFPSQFPREQRNVILTGEAYFEVVRDKQRPFIVTTRQQMIHVLGTKFNVQAYHDEMAMKTTLVEGGIRVQLAKEQQILKIGEQAISIAGHNGLDIKQADLEAVLAWKNGYFVFNDENIVDIMQKVGRWYNIEVDYVGNMANKVFAGTFSKRKSLQHLLNSLSATGQINYKIKGRRVTIMSE